MATADDVLNSDVSGTTALVTDVERRKAVPIIRALGRAGVRVVGLSSVRLPLGRWSRHCAGVHRVPDYGERPDAFLDALSAVCSAEQPDTLFPIEDEGLRLCLEHPECYEPARALLPSPDAFAAARDKGRTMQAARAAGVPIPATRCPTSVEEAHAVAAEWTGEAVVKPRESSGSRGLHFVEEPARLAPVYAEVASEYPCPLIQERLPAEGAGLGVFALMSAESEPLALFGHRRLREYPVGGGPSTLRESDRNDALIEQSVRLLEMLDWTGIAMVEYKIDARTGAPKLMEINPRFWGSLELAIQSGVDFPLLYHRAGLGRTVTPILDFPEGVRCRWLWPGDLLHFLSNPERFHLTPGFFNFCEEHYDILSTHDPGPMLGIVAEAARKLLRGR